MLIWPSRTAPGRRQMAVLLISKFQVTCQAQFMPPWWQLGLAGMFLLFTRLSHRLPTPGTRILSRRFTCTWFPVNAFGTAFSSDTHTTVPSPSLRQPEVGNAVEGPRSFWPSPKKCCFRSWGYVSFPVFHSEALDKIAKHR